jgi:signal transduction histidine kinase
MSGREHHITVDAAWVGGPGAGRVLAAGWALFAFVDVMTRLRVYENASVALGVSLVLDPIIFLLAAALHAIHDRLRFEGRITLDALPWIIGLSLAAAAVVVAAGLIIRSHFGLGIANWSWHDAALIALVHYFLIFTIWSLICFWMKAELARQAERQRAIQAEANALRIELQRLRLQLDPHFLFNALTGIGEEIQENPDAALAMLRDLSTFLRQSLNSIEVTIATVGAEAEALASYLRVQEARFGARLTTRLDIEPAALPRRIPSFLLQPLVENAIAYGRREPRLEVAVTIGAEGPALRVVITNTGTLGPPQDSGSRGGIGLANVRRRIALHYPGRHAFTLAQQGGAVVATLTLEGEPCSAS